MNKPIPTSIVSLQQASKVYTAGNTKTTALNNISTQFQEGEFTVLAGASGSGKTTLLNIVGCLDSLDSGSVTVCGESVQAFSQTQRSDFRLRSLGFIFQAYNLIPVLSAQENVEFPLALMNVSKTEARERSLEMLTQLGIQDLAAKRPAQMSGGQQQRVAVARALVHQPTLVLADEPTANLDSENSQQLISLMRDMNQKFGTTFLFASHDERVIRQASRTITMEDGAIIRDEYTAQ